MNRIVSVAAAAASIAALVGCTRARVQHTVDDSLALALQGEQASGARLVGIIPNLEGPESARYDAEQDVWFVSTMIGYGSDHDGYGYIAKASGSDPSQVIPFIVSGKNGVTLDAPKGLAIHGDTLWTADIDVLRGFDRHTGAPLMTIDFKPYGVVMLNDVATGGDGAIYISDSGLQMTDKGVIYGTGSKVFRVGAGHSVQVLPGSAELDHPNGVAWDAAHQRLLVVSFDQFYGKLYAMRPGDTTITTLLQAPGRLDGLEVLPDGRIAYTSWVDSTVHVYDGRRDERFIRGEPMPADIGVDTRRNRIAVPVDGRWQVEIWQLPAADEQQRVAVRR